MISSGVDCAASGLELSTSGINAPESGTDGKQAAMAGLVKKMTSLNFKLVERIKGLEREVADAKSERSYRAELDRQLLERDKTINTLQLQFNSLASVVLQMQAELQK